MRAWLLGVFLIFPGIACAKTGNDLLALLQSSHSSDNLKAYYYVFGVLDAEDLHLTTDLFQSFPGKDSKDKTPKKFSRGYSCPPDNTTYKQIIDLVQRDLEVNPETRHQQGAALVRRALIRAWPCGGNP